MPLLSGSAFFDTLRTYRGTIEAAVATVAALVAALTQIRGLFISNWWLTSTALLVVSFAVVAFLRDVLRRRRIQPVDIVCFVGPQPMTKEDLKARGFHGRHTEIERIVSKLTASHIRYLVLLGESGCGKTSLLQAGVIPKLDEQGRFHCVYLRFTNQPLRALRDALRAVYPAPSTAASSSPPPATGASNSLVDELNRARERSGKPLVLFIDQFEEFHLHPIGPDDYRSIQEFVWAIVGKDAIGDTKLVFSLRYDFSHLMDVFYDERYVDRGFSGGEVKVRLEPFEEAVAEDVIRRTLQNKDGSFAWEERLLRRVLGDLTMRRVIAGIQCRIVLPAELQIVCQMVQTKRFTAATYPGKNTLLQGHVQEAIDTTPSTSPQKAKQLLLSLVNPVEFTKAEPQTLQQIAGHLQMKERDWPQLRSMLEHFDQHRRIVNSRTIEQGGEQVVVYELAHDYLAKLIRVVAGAEMSGVRRSQAILQSARLQLEFNPTYRLSINEFWHLRRYPAERMNSEDLRLMQRSIRAFALRICTPALVLSSAWLFVRFGYSHVAVEKGEIVIKRGLPYVHPLFGSSKTAVSTSLSVTSGLLGHEAFVRTTDLIRDEHTVPQILGYFIPESFDIDKWIQHRFGEDVRAYIKKQAKNISTYEYTDREFTNLMVALNLKDHETISEIYEKRIEDTYEYYVKKCPEASMHSQLCGKLLSNISSIASSLFLMRPGNTSAIAWFNDRLSKEMLAPESAGFQGAFAALVELHGIDAKTRSSVFDLLNGAEPDKVAGATRALGTIPTKRWRDKLCRAVEEKRCQQARQTLGARLLAANSPQERDRLLVALEILGLPNQPMVAGLSAELKELDRIKEADAFPYVNVLSRLLRMGVHEPWVVDRIASVYVGAAKELEQLPSLDDANSSALYKDQSTLNTRISSRLTNYIIYYFSDPEHPPSDSIKIAIREYLKIYAQRVNTTALFSINIARLAAICRIIGMHPKEILQSFLPQEQMEIDSYSSLLNNVLVESNGLVPKDTREKFWNDRFVLNDEWDKKFTRWVTDQASRDGRQGCRAAKIAIMYQIDPENNALQQSVRRRIADFGCRNDLETQLALSQLKGRVIGFDGRSGKTISYAEENRNVQLESFDAAIERLQKELRSIGMVPAGTMRASVREAIRLVAKKRHEEDPGKTQELLRSLREQLKTADTPLYLRLEIQGIVEQLLSLPTE